MPQAIDGCLYHIISQHGFDNTISGKKRPRPGVAAAKGGGSNCSAGAIGVADSFCKGFIFIPEDQHSHDIQEGRPVHPLLEFSRCSVGIGFPIVIPYPLIIAACQAVSTGRLIRISQYSLICYGYDGWGTMVFSSRCTEHKNVRMKSGIGDFDNNYIVVIELHHDGLRTLPSEIDEGYPGSTHKTTNEVPTMTLEFLAQKEATNQSGGDSKISKKKAIGKDPINVTGTVDAISPILFNDSQEEPFAIMELYQPPIDEEVTDVKSAVAVIRGDEALCMHHAIHPGQSITMIGVVSRKWKVPDEFRKHNNHDDMTRPIPDLHQRLSCRVPDRVILVSEAKSIRWDEETAGRLDLSLPSTVDSLTSIRGIVKSVHFHHNRSKGGKKVRYTAHFVTMTLLNQTRDAALDKEVNAENRTADEQKLARIYLPKYSMPPNLILGLQPGSILRAINVHLIPSTKSCSRCGHAAQIDAHFECYFACLRSTLAIERCAGESRICTPDSHHWFVPRGKAFSLVPDHRITDICSDPFNSRSTKQYFAEENLRRELENRAYMELPHTFQRVADPLSAMAKLDSLLIHHHRTSTLGKVNKGSGQNIECKCTKRNCHNDGSNGRLTMRNPYAEFFDHAHNLSVSNATECGSSSFNRSHHCETTSMPRIVELKDLRNACALNFINRVAISLRSKSQSETISHGVGDTQQSSRLSPGWTSCYHYQGLHLCQVLNDYERSQPMVDLRYKAWHDISNDSLNEVYVWGSVELEWNDSTLFGDKSCVVPICEMRNLQLSSHESQPDHNYSPTWAQIGTVFVSCLCLGLKQNNHEVERSDSSNGDVDGYIRETSRKGYLHRFLPATRFDTVSAEPDGHGFVFLVDDHIFIASVQITALSIDSMDGNESIVVNDHECDSPLFERPDLLSVQECLERTCYPEPIERHTHIFGRLVRHRFSFRRVKPVEGNDGQMGKAYEGWSIVLGHVDPSAEDVLDTPSALQSIEVRMSVYFGNSARAMSNALTLAVRGLSDIPANITPDQETLGTAWWLVSGNSQSAPLLSGGLGIHPSVYLEIPYPSSCTFSKLGYQRFQCSPNEINSFFVCERRISNEHSSGNLYETEFSGKYLPGLLTRRLRREPPLEDCSNDSTRPIFSLLTKLKRRSGVPSATLAELHWDICFSLKEGDHTHLKPSLLRHIPNAKILGISFCRARVECTQCFKALTSGISSNNSHLPKSRERSIGTVDNPPKLKLSCPSGCSRSHAVVKWECSATIDDGTGQAKLYAERESALLLLGCFAVAEIEKGAWELETGVFFQPSLPMSSHLKQCLKDASTKARMKDGNLVKKRVNHNEDLKSWLSLLPADAKAEYLLHQLCRHWYQQNHSRKMDLLCRCKPLSEDVTSVNHTDIQVAKAWISSEAGLDFGNASSATLPPLKLILEDACHPSEDDFDDNIAAWQHLEKYITYSDSAH